MNKEITHKLNTKISFGNKILYTICGLEYICEMYGNENGISTYMNLKIQNNTWVGVNCKKCMSLIDSKGKKQIERHNLQKIKNIEQYILKLEKELQKEKIRLRKLKNDRENNANKIN